MSYSLWPHGLQPTRLLRPWEFPGKSTGVGCHCLLGGWRELYLLFLSEWSTNISDKSSMDLHKFLPTSPFPFLQMDPPPNKMFKPEACEFFGFFLIPPTSSLVLPIHHHALVIPLHFSRIWALSLAQVSVTLTWPLEESIISLLLHLHPPLPHFLSLHSFPTPTKSFSSLQPEQCF